MAGENISDIAKELIASGRDADTPAAWVCGVSLPGGKTFFTTLKELQFSVMKHSSPVLVIIGEVVAFESKAAPKQNILVTGTSCSEYQMQGNVIHIPLVKIEKNREGNSLLKQCAGAYQWIVFTSRYGVRFFFEILNEVAPGIRSSFLGQAKIASVGRTTTLELKKHHICPDMESETESAEGLIHHFEAIHLSNSRILLPRSNRGLPCLPEALRRMGNCVTDLPVYNSFTDEAAEKVDLTQFHKVTFSSPSGVEAFIKIYGELPEGILLTARGKTTENSIKAQIIKSRGIAL
jgi:uroporphyrinogen III methyltransferase/synthase